MELFTLFGRIAIDDKKATSKIDNVTKTAKRSEGIIGSSFKKIGKAIAAAFTVKAMIDFEKKIISTYATYDDQMRKVAAVSGATGEAYQALRDKAEEMGRSTRYSATDAGEGLEALARAGWSAEESIAGIEPVLQFATANSIELGEAAELVSDGLNQFGLEAKDTEYFVDVMSATAANSSTDVLGLKESLKNTTSMAKTFGYDVEDISVALGILGDNSIKGGRAGTQLNAAFMHMAKGGKDVNAAMEELGISLYDTQGNAKPLNEVLGDLRGAFANLTDEQKAQYASTLFGQAGMKAMMAIIGASDEDFNNLTEAIANSSGATKEMAETMDGGLGGALASVSSAWEGLLIKLGEMQEGIIIDALNAIAGALQQLPEKLDSVNQKWGELKQWFNDLSPATQELIKKFGLLVLALPPLIKIGTKLGNGTRKIIRIGKLLAPVIGGLNLKFMAISGVVGIAIAAGIALYKNWDKIKEKAGQLKEAVSEKWNSIKKKTSDTWDDMKKDTSTKWGNIKTTIKQNGSGIKGVIRTSMKGYHQVWKTGFDTMNKITGGKLGNIASTVRSKMSNIRSKIANSGIGRAWNKIWNLKIPKIKMPRFSLTGKFSLKPPQVPKFSVQWRKEGAIFTQPTIFNTPMGLQGVGEAGHEAVLPIEKLSDIMAHTMKNMGYDNRQNQQDVSVEVKLNIENFNNESDMDIEDLVEQIQFEIERKLKSTGGGTVNALV